MSFQFEYDILRLIDFEVGIEDENSNKYVGDDRPKSGRPHHIGVSVLNH